MRRLALIVTMAIAAFPAAAGPTLAGRLLELSGAPGGAVAQWQDGGMVVSSAGVRVAGADQPVTDADLWHIGSNAKSMTAALAALQVERGVIGWDDTLGDVLGAGLDIHPGYADVTLGQLLTHRGGLPANEPVWRVLRYMIAHYHIAGEPLRDQRMDLARFILRRKPKGQSGDFLYSNVGYVLAAVMLEHRTDTAWEDLIKRDLFVPLGMHSVGFGPPQGDQPQGHSGRRCTPAGQGFDADNPAYDGPAGTIHMSVGDLMIWLRANATHDPILSAESWDRLHRPVGDYAMGWGVTKDGWRAHSGSNTMWYSAVGFHTDPPRAFLLNTNCGRGNGVEEMASEILETWR